MEYLSAGNNETGIKSNCRVLFTGLCRPSECPEPRRLWQFIPIVSMPEWQVAILGLGPPLTCADCIMNIYKGSGLWGNTLSNHTRSPSNRTLMVITPPPPFEGRRRHHWLIMDAVSGVKKGQRSAFAPVQLYTNAAERAVALAAGTMPQWNAHRSARPAALWACPATRAMLRAMASTTGTMAPQARATSSAREAQVGLGMTAAG